MNAARRGARGGEGLASGHPVISTTHLFHYFLEGTGPLPRILEEGLRPLSDFPDSARWQLIERHMPGFYRQLYEDWAMPVLRGAYSTSGIFLTPIDFRAIPRHAMAGRARLRLPVDRIDPARAVVTSEPGGVRHRAGFTPEALRAVAAEWTAEDITAWFGRDPQKLFFFVPQVVTYQARVRVEPSDVEPSPD